LDRWTTVVVKTAHSACLKVELSIIGEKVTMIEVAMKSEAVLRLFVGFVMTTLAVCIANCQETRIQFKDLPPAVQETAKKECQGAKVKGYTRKIAKGKTEYEVELLEDGKSRDVTIDPEGKVLETEQEVAFDSIPERAQDAIKQQAGGAKVETVEEVKSPGSRTFYEAHIRKGTRKHEIKVFQNGEKAQD
jgi:Putative beta-lactamase-inhibitor-like, PepSY-like